MVYRGPSLGCKICRERRVKCDRQQGGCGNCSRINRQCPGFPDLNAIVFKDQTTSTITRAGKNRSKAKAKAKTGLEESTLTFRTTSTRAHEVDESLRNPNVPSKSLSAGLESQISASYAHVPATKLSMHLHSATAQRIQLRSAFASLSGPNASSATHTALVEGDLSTSSRACSLAFDALSVAQVATVADNRSGIHHAWKLYHSAIHQLQIELEESTQRAKVADDLLVAPYLLFWCERFKCVASSDWHSSTSHLRAFAHMFISRFGNASNLSHLQLLILDDVHHYILEYCLVYRRRVCCSLSDTHVERLKQIPGRNPELTQLAAQVPGLLEEQEAISSVFMSRGVEGLQQSDIHRLTILLRSLDLLEGKLTTWEARWYLEQKEPPYLTVASCTLPSNDATLTRKSLAIFKTGYKFQRLGSALAKLRICSSLLIIRKARFDLLRSVSEMSKEKVVPEVSQVSAAADGACRTILYLTSIPFGNTIGFIASTGVQELVRQWYLYVGDQEKVTWCEAIKTAIKARGLHLIEIDYS